MITLRFSWAWILISDLHHGGGLSSPGYADRLIQRDGQGHPFVTGDAVKGALRMSAEALCAFPGSGFTSDEIKNMIAQIFGASANSHFSPALITNICSIGGPKTRIVTQTAINPETGSAKDNTLRKTEVVSRGSVLETGVLIRLSDTCDIEKFKKFFVYVLAGSEWIGARTGAGWGMVKLKNLEIPKDEKENKDQIGAMHANMEKSHQQWYRLTLSLQETTCIGNKPAISNDVESLDFIPATALRGALLAHWKRNSLKDEYIETWIGPESRWSPAFPLPPVTGLDGLSNTVPYMPWPVSRIVKKGSADNGSVTSPANHVIHDVLWGQPPDSKAQWRRSRASWLHPTTFAPGEVETISTIHVARNYNTGSKVEGALYTREHIDSSGRINRFVALIRLSKTEHLNLPETIEIGKRKSAGHGLARCIWEEVGGNPATAWSGSSTADPDQLSFIVQLLSPAIVRGNGGMPQKGLDARLWNHLLGADADTLISDCRSISTITSAQSFMSTWGHGRAAVTAIGSGSVWKLTARIGQYAKLKVALERLQSEGLGERRHEGFGWIAVDPNWFIAPRCESKPNEETQK